MNRELLDPFAQDYPENLSQSLHQYKASCIQFSSSGAYLAAGTVEGYIVIWDFETFGVYRTLINHTRIVNRVTWSPCEEYLLSSSGDWRCILWNGDKPIHKQLFPSRVGEADLHVDLNRRIAWYLACVYEDKCYMVEVDLNTGKSERHILGGPDYPSFSSSSSLNDDDDGTVLVAKFDPTGKFVYSGSSKGVFAIHNAQTRETLKQFPLCTSKIMTMRLSTNGQDMAINSSDRIVRVVTLPRPDEDSLDVQQKYQDLVNKLQWLSCGFSTSGDYIWASAAKTKDIYIWEREVGSLLKILEGPRDILIDADVCHYKKGK